MKYLKSQTPTTSEDDRDYYEFTDRDRLFTVDEVEEIRRKAKKAGFVAGVSAKAIDSAAQFADLAINWVADRALKKIEAMLKKA